MATCQGTTVSAANDHASLPVQPATKEFPAPALGLLASRARHVSPPNPYRSATGDRALETILRPADLPNCLESARNGL